MEALENKIPIWRKYALTIPEAAEYTDMKIWEIAKIIKDPKCPFVLHVGKKKCLIKRKIFENYIQSDYMQFQPQLYYVYKFVNKENKVLYIGKTKYLRDRIVAHMSGKTNTKNTNLRQETEAIYYISFENECDQALYEIYLINYYQPKYNKESKGCVGDIKLETPETWTLYNQGDRHDKLP